MTTCVNVWQYLAAVFFRMRNFSDKSCRENRHTHFMFNKFLVESRSVYEIMWKNMVEPDRSQKAIGHMRITCWITKATDTNSDYVILIAFPRRNWLQERTSTLRYIYIACIVFISYQEPTLYVSIHSFDKTVNKYVSSSSRLFVSTWHYLCFHKESWDSYRDVTDGWSLQGCYDFGW